MSFLDSLASKGFTIIGVLTLVSIATSFVPGFGFGTVLIGAIAVITWAFFFIGGYNQEFEFTEKELTAMIIGGIGIGVLGVGALGFNIIPQFAAISSQLGNVFSAGLAPVALGTAAGLSSLAILGYAKRFI